MSNKSRRNLLKSIAAGSGALVAGKTLPEKWVAPTIDAVMLPAHAQTSPGGGTGPQPTTTSGGPQPTTTSGGPQPTTTSGGPQPTTTSGGPQPTTTATPTTTQAPFNGNLEVCDPSFNNCLPLQSVVCGATYNFPSGTISAQALRATISGIPPGTVVTWTPTTGSGGCQGGGCGPVMADSTGTAVVTTQTGRGAHNTVIVIQTNPVCNIGINWTIA